MTDKEPLKITLEDLAPEETPVVPEVTPGRLRTEAEQAGKKAAVFLITNVEKVTAKVTESTSDVANRSAEAVRTKVSETIQAQTKATADAVEQRLKAIDWKAEAQKGAKDSLHWLSQRLEELSDKIKPAETEENPSPKEGEDKNSGS